VEKVLKRPKPRDRHRLWEYDAALCENIPALIGVDEAGRGAFAGPVVAGAVWVANDFFKNAELKRKTKPIYDSKALTPREREDLLGLLSLLREKGLICYGTGVATVPEIEEHNILGATRIAMQRALESIAIPLAPNAGISFFEHASEASSEYPHVLIDGRSLNAFPYKHEGLVQGDAKSLVIAMASIVAKTIRDAYMISLAKKYPKYGFEAHKGYGTKMHQEAIAVHGITEAHRPSFLKKSVQTQSCDVQNEFNFTRH
jgi:ribonuclease HII